MIIAFFGHKDFSSDTPPTRNSVLSVIKDCSQGRAVTFFLGWYGQFDVFSYHVACEYKQIDKRTKICFVTPYVDQGYLKTHTELLSYDEIIYPDLERLPKRLSILFRNRYTVEKADIIFSYVNKCFGGAFTSINYARKLNKKIIDVCKLVNDG